MVIDFYKEYAAWVIETACDDIDLFMYLRGYDFSLDRFKKAK